MDLLTDLACIVVALWGVYGILHLVRLFWHKGWMK